jgi:hypothetical protein
MATVSALWAASSASQTSLLADQGFDAGGGTGGKLTGRGALEVHGGAREVRAS